MNCILKTTGWGFLDERSWTILHNGMSKNIDFSKKITFSIWYEIHKYRGKTKPNFIYDIHYKLLIDGRTCSQVLRRN